MRKLALAAALIVATVPTYASAAISTFASYTQGTSGRDLVFTAATGGATGGSLKSRTTPTAAAGTATKTLFSFLPIVGGGTASPLSANFTFNALTSAAAQTAGSLVIQGGFSGSFTFSYTGAAFTLDGQTFDPAAHGGSLNLLTGTFSNATLVGSGTSGGFFDSGSNAQLNLSDITYTSDIVSFVNDQANDLALTLTAVNSGFGVTAGGHLKSFGAVGTGSFSSDPAPLVNGATPEMATWGMMVMGFGLIGGTIRSRRVRGGIRLPVRQAEFA